MSYWHVKRTAEAKAYLDERDAEERARRARDTPDMTKSRGWIDKYRANPRPSKFNWAPRWPMTPTKGHENGEEIIEGEFTELADAAASGGIRGIRGAQEQADQGSEPAAPAGAACSEALGQQEKQAGRPRGRVKLQGSGDGQTKEVPKDWIEEAIGPSWLEEAYPEDGQGGSSPDGGDAGP